MAYKLNKQSGVIRLSDMASIPECLDNVDWREYLEWKANGNTPAPAETPEEIAERTERETKAQAMAETLAQNLPTFTKVMTAVDNITNLADARAFLKKLATVTYIHIKGDNV